MRKNIKEESLLLDSFLLVLLLKKVTIVVNMASVKFCNKQIYKKIKREQKAKNQRYV